MKKILLALSLSILSIISFAQKSCCDVALASNDGSMIVFAKNKAFVRSHLAPLPYKHVSQVGGEMITFQCPDGKNANGYLIKAKTSSNKWLFVYQEWWGLNDYIKKQSDTFYSDLDGNVNVLALDMYDGAVATKPDEASKMVQAASETRLQSIMQGGVNYVGKEAKIASVGWCFGGGLSLKSALTEGKQAIGCVMYYGMPVKDVEKLKTLNTDVLGLFATEKFITREIIEEFAENMKKAGKKLTYKMFDAEHAFANPSNPKFNPEASKEAYALAIDYLRKKF